MKSVNRRRPYDIPLAISSPGELEGSGELKKNVLKTGGSLMQVENITECSKGAFYNTFGLQQAIKSLENLFFFLSSF